MRQLLNVSILTFLTVWLGLAAFGRQNLLRDPGTFWHTALGERMLGEGRPSGVDTFSFTRGGQPWANYEWLSEGVMAVLYRIGGWDALLAAAAVLLAATYAALARRLDRAGLHYTATALLIAVGLASGSHQFHARPLLVTIAFTAWTVARLVDVEAGRRPLRSLWWLPPVSVLWTNLHAGVLAGLGTVGVCFLGWLAMAAFGRGPVAGRQPFVLVVVVGLASLAAILVNPYGLALPRAWLAVLRLPLGQMIEEHAPLDLRHPFALPTLVLAGIYLAAVASTPIRQWRATWLLPLVWLLLAAQRVRHTPLFAVAAIIVLAEALPGCGLAAWLRAGDLLRAPRAVGRWALLASAVAAMALSLGLQAAGAAVPLVGRGWATLDQRRWPLELIARLDRDPAGGRVFNDMLFGGPIIFLAPRWQVFIDDRCDLYAPELLLDYYQGLTRAPERIEDWRRQYGFDHALVVAGSTFDGYLWASAEWDELGRSSAAALYRHRGP